jgi:hypothetical protein
VSTLRKTVLTTAIIGAGLASTAGSAFATDCGHEGHHQKSHESHQSSSSSSDCTNNVAAKNTTKGGDFANVLGGAQTIIPVNACHILDNNKILNGNSLSVLGSATSLPGFPGF